MKPFFIHSTTKSGKRFTVAASQTNCDHEIRIGVSVCSDQDQFCKRTGRNKALGRSYIQKHAPYTDFNAYIYAFKHGIHRSYSIIFENNSNILHRLREFATKFAERN